MGICSACSKDDSDELNTELISSPIIQDNTTMSTSYQVYNKSKALILVHGFNRTIHELLNVQIIPNEINHICFNFYFIELPISTLIFNTEIKKFKKLLKKNNKYFQ
eukprot:492875_1